LTKNSVDENNDYKGKKNLFIRRYSFSKNRIRNFLTTYDVIIKYLIIICLYKRKTIPIGGYTSLSQLQALLIKSRTLVSI